ncbi:hypothetical protein FE782_22125 [Paenibacillus antri]|uniref:TnsA endonuclease N-terminal domain-containing protein n=1 Tax=Paenibacillus antri TaxID=2582848 RepID=A0A5R9G125_9BACL|nr:hypothetical protein [Paenibacillus antri]TLS50037.1 hypothetical protein FE782_22125 [Paenibacillus antri]
MDWRNKISWDHEDQLYAPKRKVHNKGSREFNHVIGSIPSRKMSRHISYESLWGEGLFYYFLEIDPLTVRYYPQPVIVHHQKVNRQFVLEKKEHVPDTLVFRRGSVPHLFQIKGGDEIIEQQPHLYRACLDYCNERGWKYSVERPKTLPKVVKDNLQIIMHFKNPRVDYPLWIPEILKKMAYYENPTVDYLARSFSAKTDFRNILPAIYHLIFLGELSTNILAPIGPSSVVRLGDLSQELLPYVGIGE